MPQKKEKWEVTYLSFSSPLPNENILKVTVYFFHPHFSLQARLQREPHLIYKSDQ